MAYRMLRTTAIMFSCCIFMMLVRKLVSKVFHCCNSWMFLNSASLSFFDNLGSLNLSQAALSSSFTFEISPSMMSLGLLEFTAAGVVGSALFVPLVELWLFVLLEDCVFELVPLVSLCLCSKVDFHCVFSMRIGISACLSAGEAVLNFCQSWSSSLETFDSSLLKVVRFGSMVWFCVSFTPGTLALAGLWPGDVCIPGLMGD